MTEIIHNVSIRKPLKESVNDVLVNYVDEYVNIDVLVTDLMIVVLDYFKLESIDLDTKAGIKITSDNTNLNTKVEMVETGNELNVTSVMWELDPNNIGQLGRLTLEFV